MRIVHGTNISEEELKRSKEILDKVLSEAIIIIDDDDATLTKSLKIQALETMRRKISIIFNRKPN